MWCILAAAAPEFAQPCSKMNSIFHKILEQCMLLGMQSFLFLFKRYDDLVAIALCI